MADLNFEDSIKLAYYKLVDTLTGGYSDDSVIRQFVGIGMEELTDDAARRYASNRPASMGNLYTNSGINCVQQYANLWKALIKTADYEGTSAGDEKQQQKWQHAKTTAEEMLQEVQEAHGGADKKKPIYLADLDGWNERLEAWRNSTKGKTMPDLAASSDVLDAFFTKGSVLDMSSGELENFHIDGDLSGEFSKGIFSIEGKMSGGIDFSKAAGFKASKVEFRCHSISSFAVASESSVDPSTIKDYLNRYKDLPNLRDTSGPYCEENKGSLVLYPTQIIAVWLPFIRIHVSAKDGMFIDAALNGHVNFGVGGELFGLKIGADANFNTHIQKGSNNDFVLNIVPTEIGEKANPVILAVMSARAVY
ncbi:hypothetical protein [Vogesella alkaliphila]|uniref:Uncharacterized protein n=1 Tax=Vogesella alkaliphila TaxID=1193621 RepID=A0ABQ2YDP4_9NEIS|nr:hypothetical protein [Vogesella alkaliphila]GGX80970.1 hypothetical protein GCM10011290_05900 [Vogesella alkaliphila]